MSDCGGNGGRHLLGIGADFSALKNNDSPKKNVNVYNKLKPMLIINEILMICFVEKKGYMRFLDLLDMGMVSYSIQFVVSLRCYAGKKRTNRLFEATKIRTDGNKNKKIDV